MIILRRLVGYRPVSLKKNTLDFHFHPERLLDTRSFLIFELEIINKRVSLFKWIGGWINLRLRFVHVDHVVITRTSILTFAILPIL